METKTEQTLVGKKANKVMLIPSCLMMKTRTEVELADLVVVVGVIVPLYLAHSMRLQVTKITICSLDVSILP